MQRRLHEIHRPALNNIYLLSTRFMLLSLDLLPYFFTDMTSKGQKLSTCLKEL